MVLFGVDSVASGIATADRQVTPEAVISTMRAAYSAFDTGCRIELGWSVFTAGSRLKSAPEGVRIDLQPFEMPYRDPASGAEWWLEERGKGVYQYPRFVRIETQSAVTPKNSPLKDEWNVLIRNETEFFEHTLLTLTPVQLHEKNPDLSLDQFDFIRTDAAFCPAFMCEILLRWFDSHKSEIQVEQDEASSIFVLATKLRSVRVAIDRQTGMLRTVRYRLLSGKEAVFIYSGELEKDFYPAPQPRVLQRFFVEPEAEVPAAMHAIVFYSAKKLRSEDDSLFRWQSLAAQSAIKPNGDVVLRDGSINKEASEAERARRKIVATRPPSGNPPRDPTAPSPATRWMLVGGISALIVGFIFWLRTRRIA